MLKIFMIIFLFVHFINFLNEVKVTIKIHILAFQYKKKHHYFERRHFNFLIFSKNVNKKVD